MHSYCRTYDGPDRPTRTDIVLVLGQTSTLVPKGTAPFARAVCCLAGWLVSTPSAVAVRARAADLKRAREVLEAVGSIIRMPGARRSN